MDVKEYHLFIRRKSLCPREVVNLIKIKDCTARVYGTGQKDDTADVFMHIM